MAIGDKVRDDLEAKERDDNFIAAIECGEFTVQTTDLMNGLQKIYHGEEDVPFSTGWSSLDKHYRVQLGEWCVVSGVPSHGKSAWLDCLLINLAKLHGMKFSLYSPENKPYQRHLRKLIEIYTGKELRKDEFGKVTLMPMPSLVDAAKFISEHFWWADVPNPSLDRIVVVLDNHVTKYGVQGVVIDPWNECEHNRGGLSETEYISHCLSVVREWARAKKIAVWIVAHPAKIMRNKDGSYPVPGLWDISGSAHWRAKADVGIVCHRKNLEDHGLDVHVQKVRFKTTGKPGVVPFKYDPTCNRMEPTTF